MISLQRMGVVLSPAQDDQAKFNAGMIERDGQIHMLYRFVEKKSMWHGRAIDWAYAHGTGDFPYTKNYICYARLNTDGTLQQDFDQPVLFPQSKVDAMGCEDPRLVWFEGFYYIFYCAYDNKKPRIAIAKTTDFVTYEKLGTIDHFAADKDAFIFPRRINGKIALMHRVAPSIQIDFFDTMEQLLSPESWVGYEDKLEQQTVMRGMYQHESLKIGGGVPPIPTDKGWLLLYHSVDGQERYHLCAALLDLENPTIELARLPYPLMSPEQHFETSGDYAGGTIFAQGYFLRGDELFLSCGTADKYTTLVKGSLSQLLDELSKHPVPQK